MGRKNSQQDLDMNLGISQKKESLKKGNMETKNGITFISYSLRPCMDYTPSSGTKESQDLHGE